MTLAALLLLATVSQAQTINLNDLKIVSKANITTNQAARNFLSDCTVTGNIADAITALGYSDSEFAGAIGTAVYVNQYDATTEASTGVLTNEYNTDNGWWFVEAFDSETGTETGELVAVGSDAEAVTAYITDLNYQDGKFTFTFGQDAGKLSAGKTYKAILYVVKGNDAAEITVTVNTVSAATLNLNSMEKVGEKNFESNIFYNSSYSYKKIDINADSLSAVLYSESDNIDNPALVLYAKQSEDGTLTDNATGYNGGYWMSKDGYACEWGSSSVIFCEPEVEGDLSVLHVGIYPDYSIKNTSVSSSVYIVGSGNTYYQVNLKLNVQTEPTIPECETIDSVSLVLEIVPDKSKDASADFELTQNDNMIDAFDLNYLAEELGTSTPGFGCKSMNPKTGTVLTYMTARSSKVPSSAGYLMTDAKPMVQVESMEHVATTFTVIPGMTTTAYAIGFDNNKLNFWQQPSAREVGDYYQNEFYLTNTDEAKKIVISMTVVYVEELNPKADIVAETNVILPKNNGNGDYASTQYSIEDIASAIDAGNSISEITWMAYNKLGQLLATGYDDTYGYSLDSEGKIAETDSAYVFSVGYTDGAFHSFVAQETEGECKTSIVAAYNGKGYKINVTIGDRDDADVNCDGIVDTQDVIREYQQILNTQGDSINPYFDVNKDGNIDTQDILTIYEDMKKK